MKKLMIVALITGILAACGDNSNNQDNMNNSGDSINNNSTPSTTDTSMMNTDTTGRHNPNHSQDSLRHN